MRKLFFLLLEISIGILLFGLLLFPGIDKFRANINMRPIYTVTFKDVDGLSVGSPVRLMGKQVGNITKLELLNSEIYVTFRIREKNTVIPDESIASIQFTGLAGSRSLEIMPKKIKYSTNKKIIYAQEPVRISSIMQVQTAISENILEFCRGFFAFFSKNSMDSTKKNLQTTSEYMHESNQSMDDTLKNIKKSGADLSKNTKEIQQFMNEQNKNIDSAYKSFDKLAKDPKLKNNMNEIQTTVEKLSVSMDTDKANKKVSEVTNDLNNLNSNLKNFNQKISKVKNREIDYISGINNSIQKTTDNMQGFIDSTKKIFNKPVEKSDKSDNADKKDDN
jgi:ABC-type transporter Mla subunit MlaD